MLLFLTEPSIPTALAVTLVNSSLSISWDAPLSPNGIVTYEINVTLTDLDTSAQSLLVGPLLRNDLSRLVELPLGTEEPYATYEAAVVALTSGGRSEVASDSVTTGEGGKQWFCC